MKTPRLLLIGIVLATAQGQFDGTTTLPTGWRIAPWGTQVRMDTFPTSSALSPDGKFILVMSAGAKSASISVVSVADKKETSRVPVADAWLGLTFSPDRRFVYVGGGSRNSVFEFSWNANGELKPTREMGLAVAGSPLAASDFIGDVAVSPDGRLIYAADVFHDSVVVINPQSGRMTERYKTGRRPYRLLFHPDGKSYFVSSWAEGAVYQHETATGNEMDRIRLGPQTTDMILSDRKVPDDESGARYRLFVASSNTNNIFTVGVMESKEMKSLEVLNVARYPRQPAGMTPSAFALNADQTRLYVVCSDANVVAAVDLTEPRSRVDAFLPVGAYPTSARALPDGGLAVVNGHTGQLSLIELSEDALAIATQTTDFLSLYRADMADQQPAAKSVFEHVVYILDRDRRTTEQPLPNIGKLAREFVSFNNFRSIGGTPEEAQLWSLAAIAPAFTARLAPARLRRSFTGGEPANLPPAGYLWSNAKSAGLTVRNYGVFVENGRVMDPSLNGITNLNYKGSDADRAKVFLDELKQFEASGKMAQLTLIQLDGDNQAVGQIIEGISKSRFWPKTAIFLVSEGDLLAVSPFSKRGTIDDTLYNQASVLRTIELILGLRPMTQFDAAAKPLTAAFSSTSDATPFTAQ